MTVIGWGLGKSALTLLEDQLRDTPKHALLALLVLGLAPLTSGCSKKAFAVPLTRNADHGRTIPGMDGTNAMGGPAFHFMPQRVYIAGTLENTSDTLVSDVVEALR